MNLPEYYSHIYKLAFIVRYSNVVRIRNEDVAQHSFFVAAIVLKLHEKYDFDLGKAVIAAVSHDIAEADISDVTHAIKRDNKELATELNRIERKVIRKYPAAVSEGFSIFDECTTPEGLVVNLADVLQVQQYVEAELQLGNSSMKKIHDETFERIYTLQEALKDYER